MGSRPHIQMRCTLLGKLPLLALLAIHSLLLQAAYRLRPVLCNDAPRTHCFVRSHRNTWPFVVSFNQMLDSTSPFPTPTGAWFYFLPAASPSQGVLASALQIQVPHSV